MERLSKAFRLPHERGPTLKERVLDRLRRRPDEVLGALHDVSFEVARGECVGIVGRNGSGKSTLLKCVAGIYEPDAGAVDVAGRLAPFVELGVGFEMELTGRDNVMVNGVLLGLTRAQVRERFDRIIAFAELEHFADLRLKNFSSGMGVRLAFAVAVEVDAEVLLVDEVLAVGDAAFQEKCFATLEALKREGRTILFVTHDMEAVERFCDRALLLEHGQVVAIGTPADIAARYRAVNAVAQGVYDGTSEPPSGRPPRRRTARDLRRLATVAFTLATVEFKLHYMGSALGYLWSVLRPLALFAVTYFVFTRVGTFSEGVQDYGVYLLTSLVLWTYFAEATSGSASCLLRHQELMRKLRFPRVAVPLSVVLKATFNLALNLLAVAVLIAASGVRPRLTWLELPVLIVILVALATGAGLVLSALFVRFRDIAQIWAVLSQLLFFGSCVLYVVTDFPKNLQSAAVANPLAMVFTQMRHALIDPSAPTAADVAGGDAALLIPLGVTAGLLALGVWAFAREAPRMAERL